jgi:hypothetical protein
LRTDDQPQTSLIFLDSNVSWKTLHWGNHDLVKTPRNLSFPEGLTPDIPAAECADDPKAQKIAAAAKRLDQLRNSWLNRLTSSCAYRK